MKVSSVEKNNNKQNQPSFGLSPKLLEKCAYKAFDEGLKNASFKRLRQTDAFLKGAKLRQRILEDGNPYRNHLKVYKVIDSFEAELGNIKNVNIYAQAS